MNHGSGIYCIENLVTHKKYVGQTVDLHRRWLSHLSALRNGRSHNIHLQSSFDKYGEKAFRFTVIEECPNEILNEREQFWIDALDTYRLGYNLDLGGGGIRGYHYTDEQRDHIRSALKGRVVSEEAKQKMRMNHADVSGVNNPSYGTTFKNRVGQEKYDAFCAQCSIRNRKEGNPNYGKKMSTSQKIKLSESQKARYAKFGNPLKGRKRPNLSYGSHYRAHSVVCLNTGEIFATIRSASEEYHVQQSSISSCCTGNILTAGKSENGTPLVWMYEEDYITTSQDDIRRKIDTNISRKNPKLYKGVRCITTNEVFDSMQDACSAYNIDPSSLSAHCKHRRCINGCGRHPVTNELLKWEYV